jgi:hypothetical protein
LFQVAARQAERKLEECRQEGSQLRNRLIVVEKNVINTSKTGESVKTVGSELTCFLLIYMCVLNCYRWGLKET